MDTNQMHVPNQSSVLDALPPQPALEFKDVNDSNDFLAGFYYHSDKQAQFTQFKMVHKVNGEKFFFSERRNSHSLESNFVDFKFVKYIPEGTGNNWSFEKVRSHLWFDVEAFPENIKTHIPIKNTQTPIFTRGGERSKQFIEKMVVPCGGLCGKRDCYSKFSKCGKCKIMPYCSKECQRRDWPNHKKKCFV